MKIRSTENDHSFQIALYEKLNAYSLQGLLMDSNHKFTAAVEAIEYNSDEEIKIPFSNKELCAKYLLASKLKVPFYIVTYKANYFRIFEVLQSANNTFRFISTPKKPLNENEFANWWGKLKGTVQQKPLANGAGSRANATVFDSTLEKYKLKWGGNIDGFIVNESFDKIECIIDNISVSGKLDGMNADPAKYFNDGNPAHGPKYDGWYPTTFLASSLNVPHALFTFNKKDHTENKIGLTFISELSAEKISYVDNITPNSNVLEGIDTIKAEINEKLPKMNPPTIK